MSRQFLDHNRHSDSSKFTGSFISKNQDNRKASRQEDTGYNTKIPRHGSEDDFKHYNKHNQTTVHNNELEHTARKGDEYHQYAKDNKHLTVTVNRAEDRSIQTDKKYTQVRKSGGKGEKSKEIRDVTLKSYKSEKVYPSFLRTCQLKVNSYSIDKYNNKRMTRDRFKAIRKLGQGKSGYVYLARQCYTGVIVALKVMQKSKIIQQNLLQQFIRELKIQTFLNHPNVIKNYGFFCDEKYFYTVMQLGCDGQLYDIIQKNIVLSEQSTSYIINSLLDGVNCLHQHKILHRDIKPQNIVLGNVKLCDFGWAVNKKDQLRSTFCGTPLYLSPELLSGSKYDEKVDLWAIGILAYELHVGCSPFNIKQRADLSKIITNDIEFPKNKKISRQFRQFVRAILRKNPKDRMSCEQLKQLSFVKKYQELQTCQQLCN